jgi:hypothetical protein
MDDIKRSVIIALKLILNELEGKYRNFPISDIQRGLDVLQHNLFDFQYALESALNLQIKLYESQINSIKDKL